YDRGKVLPDRSYMVKAAIRSQGRMLFATDEGQRVITKGNPHEAALWLRSATQTPAGDASRLWGTAWRLEDLAGTGVLDRIEAPLEFVAPGKVAGHGSCNRFFGSVEITGASLAFGALGSTRMACAEAIGNQEVNYLQALARAERYVVQGATLFVYAKGTEKPLRFVRKP
ncbi:MAG TPA: META domain-containing protein, partial [Burkholderiales bacterium]|nr:META domain-containing protein [Burkholderiales bacterium]